MEQLGTRQALFSCKSPREWQKNNSKMFAGRFWTTSSVASCTDSVWGRSTRLATPSLVSLFIHSLTIPHSDWRIFLILEREKVFWFEQAAPLMLSWLTLIVNDVQLYVVIWSFLTKQVSLLTHSWSTPLVYILPPISSSAPLLRPFTHSMTLSRLIFVTEVFR